LPTSGSTSSSSPSPSASEFWSDVMRQSEMGDDSEDDVNQLSNHSAVTPSSSTSASASPQASQSMPSSTFPSVTSCSSSCSRHCVLIDLPDFVLCRIITLLRAPMVVSIMLTCRRLLAISSSDMVWAVLPEVARDLPRTSSSLSTLRHLGSKFQPLSDGQSTLVSDVLRGDVNDANVFANLPGYFDIDSLCCLKPQT
jgi:hypothetical protein